MKKLKLAYFGTPEFSLSPLKTLYLAGHEIVGVFTQPKTKHSRGMKLRETPVSQWAQSQNLSVFTPVKLSNDNTDLLRDLKPDMAVLFAYGNIIPKEWLNIPIYGFLNIHASLLPRWRGAAPVQRAIEHADRKTGVTIMKMNEGLDTGPILSQKEIPIQDDTNSALLIDLLSMESCELIHNTIKKYLTGKLQIKFQDDSKSTYANKIKKQESLINWNESAKFLDRKVRAFYPYPSMYFTVDNKRYKILKTIISDVSLKVGQVVQDTELIVGCGEKSIQILEIQPEGKKPMLAFDFIKGHKLPGFLV